MNLLFLCTGNACRSQMAEGWAKRLAVRFVHRTPDWYEAKPGVPAHETCCPVDMSLHRQEG